MTRLIISSKEYLYVYGSCQHCLFYRKDFYSLVHHFSIFFDPFIYPYFEFYDFFDIFFCYVPVVVNSVIF